MRSHLPAILVLIVLFSGHLSAQDRKEVINKPGSKNSGLKEDYYVLKSDMTIKDGPYERWQNNFPVESGFYKNGQKDSVWAVYSRNGSVLSQKSYSQGKLSGVWHFYNGKGIEEWSYDFTTNKSQCLVPIVFRLEEGK